MKKVFVYATIVILSGLTSCYNWGPCIEGVGSVMEESRDVSDFYSVSNTTSFDVYVTQADSFSVKVVARETLLPVIETERSGGTLIIKTRDFTCIRNASEVEIYVSLPEIEELHLTGSGLLDCGNIEGDIVELTITSSGRMNIDSVFANEAIIKHTASGQFDSKLVDAEYGSVKMTGSGSIDFGEFYTDDMLMEHTSSGTIRGGVFSAILTDVSLTGSGRIVVHGDTRDLSTSHTSSGRMDLLDLAAVDVKTRSSGSGNTYVNASSTLDVTILGSGDVIYLGDPLISYKITGSGSLREY